MTTTRLVAAHRAIDGLFHCTFPNSEEMPWAAIANIEEIERAFYEADDNKQVCGRLPNEANREEPAVIVGTATFDERNDYALVETEFHLEEAIEYLEDQGYSFKSFAV